MKKWILIMAGCASGIACAQGGTSTFTRVEATGAVTIVLSKSDSGFVKVECEDKEDAGKIIWSVADGMLKVNGAGKGSDCLVKVGLREISGISANGASVVKSDGNFVVKDVELTANGASKIKLKLTASGVVKTSATGASEISLSGTGETLNGDIGGASSLKAGEFEVQDATITTSGSSSARVMPRNVLTVNASGASSVKYTVEPKSINANVSGSANVKKTGDTGITQKDSNEVDLGGTKFRYKPKQNFHHWSGLDLGVSAYGDEAFGFGISDTNRSWDLNYGRSVHVGLNLGEYDFHIYKNYVNLVTGFGFEWNSYAFRNPVTMNPDSTFTTLWVDSGIEYEKNKLRTTGVTMPLLLEFNSHKKNSRSFHLAAGVTLQYIFKSKSLKEYVMNGYDVDVTRKDDYNINPFRYSATVRAGYGDFTLFANYALSELFEKNKGPELYPFSVGVRLVPF
ncbi:MAG: DUF2807 domain-containing protein [Bacteroidia bacterium]|nr:DUF2807 domain-containing protein [Bacteroidia bacterium]